MFFSFDGIDGAGKSTQISRFVEWLKSQGFETTVCRDPGSTELGESLREVLLDTKVGPIGDRAEMLIYMAARAQLVDEVIRPAVEAGRVVVSDRYLLANLVYQGYGSQRDIERIRTVGKIAVDGVMPDLVFLLDIPVDVALNRINRPLDRIESKGVEYLQRVRDGFRSEAKLDSGRIAIVDATLSADQIHEAVVSHAVKVIQKTTSRESK